MASTARVSQDQRAPAKASSFQAFLERKECSQLFIICCGQAGRVMMHPMEFLKETQLLSRNLLIIRDVAQTCYQRGVSDEARDIPALIEWLRQRVQALPHIKSVYCVGSSGGAYMAMLAGHFLKADAVWAFAPPVRLRVDGEGNLDYVDPRFADVAAILAEGNGVTRYRVYFNEGYEPDLESCSLLSDTPGVQLFPQAGGGHGVVLHLAATNRLSTMFPPVQRV